MPDRRLPPPTAPAPLLAWLVEALRPMSRTKAKELLASGRVAVNGTPTTRFDHPLTPADRVTVADRPSRPAVPFPVVFADAAVLVIDKPAGLLTVATDAEKHGTAFARLASAGERPVVVHRLDRDTSGLLLFARTPSVRDALQTHWDDVAKTYLAVVEGVPRVRDGVIDTFLAEGRDLRVRAVPPDRPGAKRAISRYRVVRERGGRSLVEVALVTGRKHQIRVHLAGLGCPVVGDRVYGAATDPAGRLGLHAWRLGFAHPVSGGRVELEAPLPDKLRRLV
ncbi:MAG: RluA family pseudouridine synthase [Gemmataceae bacterium]